MKPYTTVLASLAAAALGVSGLLLITNEANSPTAGVNRSSANAQSAPSSNEATRFQSPPTASLPQKHLAPAAAQADAESAYELVAINMRCQIDREAGSGHIPLASEGLCKDLALKPLSREEIFKAITYAAENGSVKAQLDYSVYAARIFEDEKYAFDTDLIREYKENTVRFLEAAASSGHTEAYVQLSDVYKYGSIAPKDPAMSYAYAEAYVRTNSSPRAASYLRAVSSGLDGAQLRRGKVITSQILNKRSSSR